VLLAVSNDSQRTTRFFDLRFERTVRQRPGFLAPGMDAQDTARPELVAPFAGRHSFAVPEHYLGCILGFVPPVGSEDRELVEAIRCGRERLGLFA
jgi:hypothetical protein